MNFLLNKFSNWSNKRRADSDRNHREEIKKATTFVFDRYEKTFKDLAKYDKEKDSSGVLSR